MAEEDALKYQNDMLEGQSNPELQQLLQSLSGAGGIPSMLEGVLMRVFSPVLNAQGFGQSFMSNAAFGPRDAALGMQAHLFNTNLYNQMNSVAQIQSQAQRDFTVQFYDRIGAEVPEASASGFGLGTMASNFLFNQLYQPQMFNAGLQNMMMYMGTGSEAFLRDPEARSLQTGRNNQASLLAGQITELYYNDNQNTFNGLRGGDAAQVVAELGRVGAFRNVFDTSGGEVAVETEELRRVLRQAADTMRNLRSVFGGDLTQALDQANALFGGNLLHPGMADFGRQLAVNMRSVGGLTGFTQQQIGQLGGMASGFLQQNGADPFASLMLAGQIVPSLLSSQRMDFENSSPFVNEGRLRGFTVARAAGASESRTSQAISGLYALTYMQAKNNNLSEEQAVAAAREAVTRAVDQGGVLSASSLAQGTGFTASELMAASNLEAAIQFRVTDPLATMTALRQNFALVNTARRAALQGAGLDRRRLDDIEGPLTMAALEDAGFSPQELARAALIFSRDAQAFGVNQFEMDQMLASAYDTQTMSRINEQLATSRNIDRVLGGRGLTRGFAGLAELIRVQDSAEGANRGDFTDAERLTLRQAWNAFTGNMNLSAEDKQRLLQLGDAFEVRNDMTSDQAIRSQAAEVGANMVVQMLSTGRGLRARATAALKERLGADKFDALSQTDKTKLIKEEVVAERARLSGMLHEGDVATRQEALANLALESNTNRRLELLEQIQSTTYGPIQEGKEEGVAALDKIEDMLAKNPNMSFQQARRKLSGEERAALDTFLEDMQTADSEFADTELGQAMQIGPMDRIVELMEEVVGWIRGNGGLGGGVGSGKAKEEEN